MKPRQSRITQVPLARWLIIEFTGLSIFSLLWWLHSPLASYSAFIGGLIFIVPNAWFVHRVYRYQGARNAHLMVGNLFRAESTKIALTAVFFAAVFTLMEPVHVPALLFTFAVMVLAGGALRWLIRPQPRR
ncbi:ATP synthase subunit I [Marinobacter xiaoshiensis]|uniref:ATP synthase subunit I n=1 Tax=Marinobacter xiaoshiensis TaxID=3073652 RepID=A0ABU2HDB7_9GAMM|nr:ATP synthase subunit I [Marinobacter sp. F60267]MDS1309029.1 ATP synthase subunit I [Marinobacter sp. F60267]